MMGVTSLIVFLTTAVLTADMHPLHYRELDSLTRGSEAVNAVLATDSAALCSLILFVDSKTSSRSVSEIIGNLKASEGIAVFAVAGDNQDYNETQAQLCRMVDQARRLRQVSRCLRMMVVSDDAAFLVAFAECSLEGRLLVWSNRLLAVTRLSLQQLQQLHETFSQTNSILLLVNTVAGYLQDTKALRVASWTPKRGLVLTTHLPLFPNKFYKFLQKPSLVVAGGQYEPHVNVLFNSKTPQDTEVTFYGPMINLLEIFALNINFSYRIVRPPDGVWGAKMPNGTWIGMVGMVVRKEVDFALGPFGITAVRYEAADYTRPIVIDYARIMARRGRPEVDPWGFVLPLAPLVWAATLTTLLLLCLILLLLSKCSSYLHINRETTASYSVLDYLRVLLQQDVFVRKGSWWQRMLLIAWMTVTLVLTRSYSGNLMSLLAVRYSLQPYQTLQDAVDDPSVALIWEEDSSYVQSFRRATSGIYKAVTDLEKIGRNVYLTFSSISERAPTLVRRGDHVLVLEENSENVYIAQDFSTTERCDFYLSREKVLPLMFAMIGRKNSPLVPVLSNRIRSVKEAGLYDYWMKTSVPNSSSCAHTSTKTTVKASLSLTNLSGMFVVLVSGYGLGLLVFGLEAIIDWSKMSRS
ncbi:probable glutamate receptor isoform X2 [Cherax quadricarinatus]|uniref:probable glutamate receptor isoform X2 n=1 Tax=Cherax quadricarinatus TaxID=27406 RepID=UPI00387E6E07